MRRRISRGFVMPQFRSSVPLLLGCLFLVAGVPRTHAQEGGGVRLQLKYQPEFQPGLVVLPFAAAPGLDAAAGTMHAIVRQDLDFSDRFQVKDAGTQPGEPPNLALWKQRGADWVVQGAVRSRPGGTALELVLQDAVYGREKARQTFALPPVGSNGFRMAVHAAADEVVRWVTGEPGAAASRIAFVLQGRESKELYMVDSDGENVQRITSDGSINLSPAWAPDGGRIAYTSYRTGLPLLYERDPSTGRDRLLSDRSGLNITPAYAPRGGLLAFATTVAGNTEVATYDRGRGCCLVQQTRGSRFDSLSPTFAPDGSRIAFVSNRLGEPQIYVMPLGGEARLVSSYLYGERGYNTGPDWSPRGDAIAYSTRVGGIPQIAVVSAAGGTPRLLTNSGSNEDPSWAADARHLVFASRDRDGGGLFVLDTVSGRVRPLLRGRGYGLPAWSPVLLRSAS